jgi:ParB/RepB/Spo0J family partition protein
MPSGDFRIIPIASIIVEREGRQRRELEPKALAELADSIARLGLIHPPVITRDRVLVAGERRIEAMRSLGWDQTPIQYTDEVDPATLKALELEENIKRLDVPWQQRCRAVAEYHALQKTAKSEWTQAQTASALGLIEQSVSDYIKVAKELDKGTEKVVAAPKYSTALGTINRREQRAATVEIERFQTIEASDDFEIITADFLEWAAAYQGPKFNLIHCDFPLRD